MVSPSALSRRQRLRQLALFQVAQTGGRLVEQQQHGIEAERAGDLDDAQLAEREAAGRPVHDLRQPHALDLAGRLVEQARLLARDRGAPGWRKVPLVPAQVGAQGHVLEHAHVGLHIDMLEGARDAAAGHELRRRARRCARP